MDHAMSLARRTGVLLAGVYMLAQPASQREFGSASVPLRVEIQPECDVAINEIGLASRRTERDREVLSGSVAFRYRVRTGAGGGGGAIQLRLHGLADSSRVNYRASLRGAGAAETGEQVAPAGGVAELTVVNFGPNQHSSSRGDLGSVTWNVYLPEPGAGAPVPSPRLSCEAH